MRLGPYQFIAQRGVGPDGAAYQATTEQGQVVEVRVLSGERIEEQGWSETAKRLQLVQMLHDQPGVQTLVQSALDHEPAYVVLEEVVPKTLADLPEDELPWPRARVWEWGRFLAATLAAAHRFGLVHGSLGPAAIRWEEGQGIKLDFTGLRCRPPADAARWREACQSPELAGGKTPDAAADLFALGVILSWLLLGRPALPGWSYAGEADSLVLEDPALPLLQGLLAVDPEDRPSAQTLLEGLRPTNLEEMAVVAPAEARFEQTRVSHSPVPSAVRLVEKSKSPQQVGRFRLLEMLGEGGLGRVYRAEDVTDGAPAAIKLLHPHLAMRPSVIKRFQKEARLLREVNNPFVANLLEVNQDDGLHYLAMEYIVGPSLNKVQRDETLCPGGKMPEPCALALMIDMGRALADAHRRGVIHRDIKPQNIMVLQDSWLMAALTRNGRGAVRPGEVPAGHAGAKLCDFGLARHVVETESLHLTQEGMVVGTPLYMSPEQAAGKADIGPSTDVYSLGATLYHLLTGRPPFDAESALALSLRHAKEAPPPMRQFQSNLSDGVCRIVERCLAKKPEERFADAGDLLDELERLVRGEPAHLVVHPRLPATTGKVLQYDWSWELAAEAEQLWPYVSNTERLNRAVGIPAVHFSMQPAPAAGEGLKPGVDKFGEFRKAGFTNAWREHPFEWIEGRRLGVLREYSQGVFKWLATWTELVPNPQGGCLLKHQVRVEPRNFLGRLVAAIEVGFKGRRRVGQVYRRIDAYVRGLLQGAEVDPFEAPAGLSRAGQRRLQTALEEIARHKVPAPVLEQLGFFLQNAPDQDVARIRPLALARRLGVDADDLVAACLHGVRAGLLILLWDLICPLCRIPAGMLQTLKALEDHGHCPACNADFPLDFANSVEAIFRVHPDLRPCDTRTYCVGGPAHSPHVVAQVRVGAGECFELDLSLSAGSYRLRGPQLPRAWDFQVDQDALLSRWALQIPADFLTTGDQQATTIAEVMRLRPGRQRLLFHNGHTAELVLRVERSANRQDALTAARAASSALFRELFPGEVLEAGRLATVAAMTFLVVDLNQAAHLETAGNLYQTLGESRAFSLLHDFFLLVEASARKETGAVIKTLGDAVLVAFEDKAAAVRAALALGQDWRAALAPRWPEQAARLQLRCGLHHGPAMAATVNGRLDYFGSTVDLALRLPGLVQGNQLALSRALAADFRVAELLRAQDKKSSLVQGQLPGETLGVVLAIDLPPGAGNS